MDTQETKDEGKGGCCAKSKCCGCKALAALLLVAAGWTGGYFCSRHCAAKNAPPAASAPANPAQ